jgi:hypothetical protein
MPRDPAAVALAMIAAEPDESPPSADELTALALAHLDTIRAQRAGVLSERAGTRTLRRWTAA